jgi:hypothetical protein
MNQNKLSTALTRVIQLGGLFCLRRPSINLLLGNAGSKVPNERRLAQWTEVLADLHSQMPLISLALASSRIELAIDL